MRYPKLKTMLITTTLVLFCTSAFLLWRAMSIRDSNFGLGFADVIASAICLGLAIICGIMTAVECIQLDSPKETATNIGGGHA